MFEKKTIDKTKLIRKLVENRNIEDRYILDDENSIIVIKNDDKDSKDIYLMIHQRLVDGKLVEINRWSLRGYYFGMKDISNIKELGLFKVQNGHGAFNALYDYKNDKFVISQNTWEIIDFGRNNQFLEKYDGILGIFGIVSDYEEDDVYSYINPVTGEKKVKSFSVSYGNYYAFLDLNGKIRDNKLFRGNSLSEIESQIDLVKEGYESLEEFKKEKKQLCNEDKREIKEKYKQMIKERNDGSISPYLDTEVAKVAFARKLEKRINDGGMHEATGDLVD